MPAHNNHPRWRTTYEWRKRVRDQLQRSPLCQRCREPAVTVELMMTEPPTFDIFLRLPVVSLCGKCAVDWKPYPPFMGLDGKPRWER